MTGSPERRSMTWARRALPYAQAIVTVVLATSVASLISPPFDRANVIMVFLLGVVVVATACGRGPSIVASILGVAAFDFFFVPPYFRLSVADSQYLVTFAVMLIVALVISSLTARIRRQADAAHERERRTAALLGMSRALAETSSASELLQTAARRMTDVFGLDVTMLVPDAGGRLAAVATAAADPADADDAVLGPWVLEHGEPAGPREAQRGTGRATYLPLSGRDATLGVVRCRPAGRERMPASESRRQLDMFVNQTAVALERARLAADAEDARVRARTEHVKSVLLTSVSHDLRTPLATITGAATTMLEDEERLAPRLRHELLESIRDEADRLNRLVQNLLGMTRLESGALALVRDWHPIEEVIGAALGRQARRLGDRRVTVTAPADLPLVPIDDVLVEQLLENLLDNVVKYTPPDTAIRILATATERAVTVEIADRGPGLARGAEDQVFEKFYRGPNGGNRGSGLGLAICRGIVDAHGGRIWAQNLPEGGVAFLFTLPLGDASPASVPADA